MFSREEKQKAPSVTPTLSWTCHYKRPWVGSFVLLNVAQWKLQTSLGEIYHWILTMSWFFFYSRQPWILKAICCDLLPKRWLQGSGTASLFFFVCVFPFWVHSCYKAAEIPSLSIKTCDKSGHLWSGDIVSHAVSVKSRSYLCVDLDKCTTLVWNNL